MIIPQDWTQYPEEFVVIPENVLSSFFKMYKTFRRSDYRSIPRIVGFIDITLVLSMIITQDWD